MDNQGDDFPGGSPPGRNNNNVRGGSGLHNDLFSSSLGSMDPQYAAALDFEQLRMRHQLEVQQDIEFRRRLMKEQQHQLLSELEYRNKIQQLQEIQELQAQQQQQQQQQQQGLNQILAQNPRLLEMHQQQQYHSGRDNSLLSTLREDFLLQRHQLMLQDQMQQQLQEQLSRDSQQKEQEDLLAMLQASGNLKGDSSLPADVASLRQEEASSLRQEEVLSLRQKEAFRQPPAKELSPALPKPPPSEPAPVPAPAPMEELFNNSNIQTAESASTDQERVQPQTDADPGTRKRNISESTDETGKGAYQDPPREKEKTPAKESPQIELSPAEEAAPKAEDAAPKAEDAALKAEASAADDRSAKDRELDAKVAQLLESQKLPVAKQKAKGAPEKKGKKKKGKAEEKAKNNGGRKRKAPAASPVGKKPGKKEGRGDDAGKGSDQEQSVIDFLGSMGTNNGNSLKMIAEKGAGQSGPKKRIKGGKDSKEKEQKDDEAVANLVMNLKRSGVTTDEVQDVNKWSREVAAPEIPPEKIPFHRRPGLKFNLPSLPVEPELTDADSDSATPSTNDPPMGTAATAVRSESNSSTAPSASDGVNDIVNAGAVRFISAQKRIFKPKRSGKGHDEWWPSNALIRRENRKRGACQDEEDTDEEADAAGEPDVSFVKAGVDAAKKRLAGSVEPGVLEKLPHCKLYDEFREKNDGEWVPKFCCQTTETFPSEAMVCCSVCSTWRHAQCGGHYRRYTPNSVHPSNVVFQPVCDQCYFEKRFVDGNATAETRLERQRIQHLRRCNATNSVVRQVAFGKHSGQYKWPLGSVSVSHITGHIRSVQARHEKAEKQWSEMTARLGTGKNLKPRERQRMRKRELERLFVSIEDAEGVMDRHNMALFLQSDTSKLHPAGFEVPHRNIFDPSEDPVYASVLKDPTDATKPLEGLDDRNSDDNRSSKVEPVPSLTKLNKRNGVSPLCAKEENANPADQKIDAGDDDPSKATKCHTCSREGCTQIPRFDSIFCSDSCGVSALETDLLRSLQCAGKLHPSILRS